MSGVTLTGGAGGSMNAGAVELTESGGRALKLQTDAPHLVSMGGGRLSTAVTLHPLPQGRVTLGSSPTVDINVQGTGVAPMHCHIENCGGVVTIYPQSENLSIDGARVTCPTRLSQGAMLTIGRSNYMRFNHPAEAKLIKAAIPNSRISMTPMTFDMEPSYITSKYTKKPPVAPRKRESLSDEEPPSSFMTKVTKFEYLASQNMKKSISPKVFSSNLVTVNMPAKEVLGKAAPDLETFAKSLPQSALNYSELNHNEKQKIKTPDRQIFGRKSPNYVNVTLNETKSINNKVVIYENGCVPKRNISNLGSNEQLSNDLNIMNNRNGTQQHLNKTVNVSRTTGVASPGFNNSFNGFAGTNCSNNFGGTALDFCGDESVLSNISHGEDGSQYRKTEAELQRNQAQVNRLIEQQTEKAEQLRLEEILNMCAEYEKQVQCEKTNKPMTPNRIKTNGSLPRDKRQCISPNLLKTQSPTLASSSPHLSNDIFNFDNTSTPKQNNSYENVSIPTLNISYENITPKPDPSETTCSSPYENINLPQNNFQQSPRTRIKTFVTSKDNKDTREMKSTIEMIESKFAAVQIEHNNLCLSLESPNKDDEQRKPSPIKFIMPLEVNGNVAGENGVFLDDKGGFPDGSLSNVSTSGGILSPMKIKQEESVKKVEELKAEKKEHLAAIAKIKRQIAEIEIQGEELHRDLQMEKALILGEYKSKQVELEKLQSKKEKLQRRAQKIDDKMKDCQGKQEEDQRVCKEKLSTAQDSYHKTEKKLTEITKGTPEYEEAFEEYLAAQEILENERKAFEDLEFHHLEEEADWLASREELQREIMDLSGRIEELNSQILELENQQGITFETNANEYKKIEQEKIELSKKIEVIRAKIKVLDDELSKYSNQESEQEFSSDSDSSVKGDKVKTKFADMSVSVFEANAKNFDDLYNISQSFNEKMLQEKNVLDGGVSKKFPSQDDIDRISKVTIDSPMNYSNETGSLNRKTIESLKEIERNRKLHLEQQGCQVIETERLRVQALKQRVQQEVRVKWAQRSQDCSSMHSTGSDDTQYSISCANEPEHEKITTNGRTSNQHETEPLRARSEGIDSPRPLSETSDISVEVGTLNKKRNRPVADKHRPLTRYLPIRSSDLDLKAHIESAGHQVVLCPHVTINSSTCRGFLHKRGSKLNGWSRRWFVFDRNKRTLVYYSDKTEKKARGGAYFQAIEEVYLDHSNSVKSPNPQLTFIVKTHERSYHLMAPSPEAMRIWIDVIFTGAEGYQEFEHGT